MLVKACRCSSIDFSLPPSPPVLLLSYSSFIIESSRILSKETLSHTRFIPIFFTCREVSLLHLRKESSMQQLHLLLIARYGTYYSTIHTRAIIFDVIGYVFRRIVLVGDDCSLERIGGIIVLEMMPRCILNVLNTRIHCSPLTYCITHRSVTKVKDIRQASLKRSVSLSSRYFGNAKLTYTYVLIRQPLPTS